MDLSRTLYKAIRAVGGGWTEFLRSDKELELLAHEWAEFRALPSHRTCLLCCAGVGTPRHTIMRGSQMADLVDSLRVLWKGLWRLILLTSSLWLMLGGLAN